MIIENEYRVIGPPGCIAGDAIISVNRIGVGDAGITRKMRLDYLVERFNSAVPGGYFRGNGYARKTTTLWDSLIKTRVRCMSPEGLILLAPLVRAIDSGLQEVHEVVLENGCKLRATHDHEFAVVGGMASLSSLAAGDLLMVDAGVARKDPAKKKSYLEIEGLKYHPFCHRVAAKRYSVLVHRLTVEADMNGVSLQFFVDSHRNGFAGNANWRYLQKTQVVHHKDRDVKNNSIGNLEVIDSLTEHSRLHCNEGRWKDVIAKASTCKIAKINKYVGEYPVFDLTVYVEDGKSGNYLANDIVVSNCGKTTYLSSQVKQRVDRWCSDTGEEPRNCTDVLVSSLTKAAANEVLSRGLELPSEQIGTLHAHALHALGNPKLCVGPKQISQWNKESKMDHWLGGGVSERNEDGFDIGAGKYRGDSLNAEYTINRCRLVPREQWSQDVVDFATAYEKWKYKNDYLDYTDLIHRAYERKVAPPGNPSTILVDECQDHDRAELRLLRYWATCVNKLIIVGDPDQCQPGDTRVDISGGGSVRLDELNENSHRLVSYDRHSAKLIGLRHGMRFKKAKRTYTGRMTTVSLDNGKATKCTHDHRWLAKWKEKKKNAYVVYVMHKGDRWRVGWCKLWGACGLHFSQRCRLESADAGWIIKTFDTSRAAAVYEKIAAVKYGLPLICFNPRKGHEYVDEVFQALDPGNQALKATLCLSDHGRDYHHPFWNRRSHHEKQGSRTPLIVRACNLLPEYMQIPERTSSDKSAVSWHDFKMDFKFVRDTEVFSLDVETHHNYVADGIVTMNNLYEWRGSDPGGFYESQIPPGQTKVLEQSYRVPRRVHSEAMQMIARSQDRTPVIYHPRDEEGEVDHACYSMRHHPQEVTRHIAELLEEPDSAPGRPKVMCLFSCAYMTNPLCAALRADGIPFWNPYSKERGNFNPLHPSKGVSTVQRLLAFLKPSRDCYGDQAKLWNWSEFHSWVELCTADGWLRHGAKANIKRRAAETPTQVMSLEDIDGVLASPAVMQDLQDVNLDFLGRFISDQKVNAYNFAVDVVRRRGYNDLLTNPRVVVGTIHCSPGDEPVLTNTGYVPIAELDHRKHLLCGYMHKCNRIVWGGHGPAIDDGKRGYGFRKCSRRYVGDLVVIETARSKTRVTPCHRIRVKYTKDYSSAWIVYLMRRGNWWRVGMCRAGKLGQRLSAERGDGAWIVGVFGNKDEAHVAEVRTQVTYGLASLVFVNKHKQAVVDSFHEEMSSVSGGRARRLLKDIKKLEEHPIHTRNGRIRDVTAFETVAANFISGFMLMPVAPVGLNTKSTGIKPDWITGTSHTQPFDGLVYSLEVLPHEHYISGGAVVHNSVKGAEADHVILCPDLSTQGWETFGTSAHRDSIHRLFYVGLTRAYRRLVLTAPSTPQAVQW